MTASPGYLKKFDLGPRQPMHYAVDWQTYERVHNPGYMKFMKDMENHMENDERRQKRHREML